MTQVKICGLTTPGAVDAAIKVGADYLGFVIFKKSPRHLEMDIAEVLSERARGRVKVVALVVDPDDTLLETVIARIKPDIVQLHGNETAQRVAQIRHACDVTIWKAVAVASQRDVEGAVQFDGSLNLVDGGSDTDLILYDAKPPSGSGANPGGNGLAFDWRILADPGNNTRRVRRPFALAGGLTSKNVAAAIDLVAPHIVDVSSAVESAPGTKDPELIEAFIRAAKTAKRTDG